MFKSFVEKESFILDSNLFKIFLVWLKSFNKIKNGVASAKTYYNRALFYSWVGKSHKACLEALKALKKDNKNPYVWWLYGLLRKDDGLIIEKIEKYFLKSLKYGGDNFHLALYELISCEALLGNSVLRNKYEKKFLDIGIEDSAYLLKKYYIYLGHYRWKEAFPCLINSIKRYFRKGNIYRADFISYIVCFSNVIEEFFIKIFFPSVQICAEANFMFEVGNEIEANRLYLKAADKIKNIKEKEVVYENLLSHYYEQYEYKKCIDIANRILIKYKYPKAYEYKAWAYREMGNFEQARKVLKIAYNAKIDIDMQDSDYYNGMALTYFKEGDYSKAVNWLNKQIMESPSSHPFLYKAFCLEEMNELDDAIKAYNKSLEYEPEDLAYYRAANLYYVKNDYQKALKFINQSLMLNKDSYNYSLKGDILTAMKRIKEARFCYKLADNLE